MEATEMVKILCKGDDAATEKMFEEQFGVEGAISKKYAAEGGDALFSAFLKELNAVPDTNPYKESILAKARTRHYHDFEGGACPKLDLVMHLTQAGLVEMAEKVKNGEYDF